MLPGIAPLVGLAESQLAPETVAAVAVKLVAEPVVAIAMVWAGGGCVPERKVKVRELGVEVRLVAAVTVRITGTWTGLPAPIAERVMVPVYVFGVSPAGFTDTVRLPGVVALLELAESQFPPLAVAVNPSADTVLPTATLCDGGSVPPA